MSPEDLVVLTTFSTAHEAQVLRAELEAADIDVYLENEHVVGTNWFWSNLVGGVRVMVPPDRLEEAREILDLPLAAGEIDEQSLTEQALKAGVE